MKTFRLKVELGVGEILLRLIIFVLEPLNFVHWLTVYRFLTWPEYRAEAMRNYYVAVHRNMAARGLRHADGFAFLLPTEPPVVVIDGSPRRRQDSACDGWPDGVHDFWVDWPRRLVVREDYPSGWNACEICGTEHKIWVTDDHVWARLPKKLMAGEFFQEQARNDFFALLPDLKELRICVVCFRREVSGGRMH